MIQVNTEQASDLIEIFWLANQVPFIHGSPAIGKSAVVNALAKKHNLKVIDFTLSQREPTDLAGFVTLNGDKAMYVPLDDFPLEDSEIPEGYSGWCLFLDEMNSAVRAVQAACFRLILDRAIGKYKLHEKVKIVCAGNLETDNAIVEAMSTPMQSRLCHIHVVSDLQAWLNWAYQNDVPYQLTAFLEFSPNSFYTFDPKSADITFASSRTWHFASDVFKVAQNNELLLIALAGTIGEGTAREFCTYLKLVNGLPTVSDILKNPESIRVPEEPSTLYAISGAIAQHTNKDNLVEFIKFTSRLPKEFEVICLRQMIKRDKSLVSNKVIQKWIEENRNELF